MKHTNHNNFFQTKFESTNNCFECGIDTTKTGGWHYPTTIDGNSITLIRCDECADAIAIEEAKESYKNMSHEQHLEELDKMTNRMNEYAAIAVGEEHPRNIAILNLLKKFVQEKK